MKETVYLVTGAAGFLGSTTVRQLTERGDSVRAFVLPGDDSARYLPAEADIVCGDLTDEQAVEQLFTIPEGMESVCLHIASIVTTDPSYSQKVMDVNVGGTEHIIRACMNHPECRKLVYCSSTGAIEELPKGQVMKEQDQFDETKVVGCYSMSKAIATQRVLDAVKEQGLNACVVHPTGIMGPCDNAVGETTRGMIQIINGELPAGINGTFNLADVRDLADGILRAAEYGKQGECYILGNEVISFREFTRLIAEESGAKPVRMFLPLPLARLMAKMLENHARRTGTKPVMTEFSVYNLARNNEFDSSKAKRELGYHTRSCRETVIDEIAWLKQTGKIENRPAHRSRHAMAS